MTRLSETEKGKEKREVLTVQDIWFSKSKEEGKIKDDPNGGCLQLTLATPAFAENLLFLDGDTGEKNSDRGRR